MLEALVLILHRGLQPVLRIQIHHDPALVETMMALRKVGLHDEGEEALRRLHLQHRGVVVSEMIVGPLPEIGMRVGRDRDPFRLDAELPRLPRPGHFLREVHVVSSVFFRGITISPQKMRQPLQSWKVTPLLSRQQLEQAQQIASKHYEYPAKKHH